MKITVKQAIPNLVLTSLQGLNGRDSAMIMLGRTCVTRIPPNSKITIVEKPKSYQGSGRCVKFTVDNDPEEYYEFWLTFKKYTTL